MLLSNIIGVGGNKSAQAQSSGRDVCISVWMLQIKLGTNTWIMKSKHLCKHIGIVVMRETK